ncbi:MAG: nucleotide sugar dehydrogenase [Hyphomonadaceae bacterium]
MADAVRPGADKIDEAFVAAFEARAAASALTIGVIGMGYVGLPLAMAFAAKGFVLHCFDVDAAKIEALAAGRSYMSHIADARVAALAAAPGFHATADFAGLDAPDVLVICVPTPISAHREPDLSYVSLAAEAIGARLRRGQLVVLESTTYPGTTEDIVRPPLERLSGLIAGRDFALGYSPEREDPGNPKFDTATIPKVVGANSDLERRMLEALYGRITQTVPVRDLKTAEAVKLTENIFRMVNIALVNELKFIFRGMDIDAWEVIDAAKTKPFGFMPFYPGPGLGGHCIPVDPFYLTWKARAFGESTRFIDLAGDVLTRLPRYTIDQVSEALSTRQHKALAGAEVLVLGVAYKRNVDDLRESPALLLIELLERRGAKVRYHDPFVPAIESGHGVTVSAMQSTPLTAEVLRGVDAVLIATDHDTVDYRLVCENASLVLDARNATAALQSEFADRIVKV